MSSYRGFLLAAVSLAYLLCGWTDRRPVRRGDGSGLRNGQTGSHRRLRRSIAARAPCCGWGRCAWRACASFLAFTPDGKTLVTGEMNAGPVIRFWDAATGIGNWHFPSHRLTSERIRSVPGRKVFAMSEEHDGSSGAFPTGRRFDGLWQPLSAGGLLPRLQLPISPDGKFWLGLATTASFVCGKWRTERKSCVSRKGRWPRRLVSFLPITRSWPLTVEHAPPVRDRHGKDI